jgi:DNA-binding NarL/FixJ family response regulator
MSIKTILVEDSKAIRDALIPTMAELGDMEVVAVAETASEAVAALDAQDGTWQLAVVDLFLKQGSGLDVLRACAGRRVGRVVVVLSNYATPRMREQCRTLGADGMFDKSTQLDAFFDFCALRFEPDH